MTILLTGGTGSFGRAFCRRAVGTIRVYSRDEAKQAAMKEEFKDKDIRYLIGDVRDQPRLQMAMEGCDAVIHAAALKRVEVCEYDPYEAFMTNVYGTWNVVCASRAVDVKRVILLSTDKACKPITAYGHSKANAEVLFLNANSYTPTTCYSAVRYGNVAGSRGSVIPFFKQEVQRGEKILPVTDYHMTRFWMTLDRAVGLVETALSTARGGEVFVPKMESFWITDLVRAFGCTYRVVGIREKEKLHEDIINEYDTVYDMGEYYIISPTAHWKEYEIDGEKMPDGWSYSSHTNDRWLSVKELKERL